MGKTNIEWASDVWNPLIGCSRVSEGCRHCYAERQAFRAAAMGISRYDGITKKVGTEIHWTGEVRLVASALDLPLRWKTPRRIFVNSMSDLFHEAVPDEWIGRIFEVMGTAKQHVYQILTKRPERMLTFVTKYAAAGGPLGPWPWPHIWLGVSVENQATADARIPLLLQTPAAVRWVSYEPALGPVDFRPWLHPRCQGCGNYRERGDEEHAVIVSTGDAQYPEQGYPCGPVDPAIDWLVVGGESGPGARPFDLAWARQTIVQGRIAGVPIFVKQVGSKPITDHRTRPEGESWIFMPKDRKGGDPQEWPEDLRVREYPEKG